MCEKPNLLKPPECVKNMQLLDRSKFTKPIKLPYIDVGDKKVSDIIPLIKKYTLKIDSFKPVINEGGKCTITLNPLLVVKWNDIEETVRNKLSDKGITSAVFKSRDDTLRYENFTIEDVFRSVLPEDKEGMASFTAVGHIVHVNLRDHLLPYKKLIGEVLLDKVSGCKTVVNKLNNIDNTFRYFQMEVLSGIEDFNVTVKENRCSFKFDFSKVYWNSRLCTEHERIVNNVKKDDVLFDVFAGVGPFSIPAARKKCTVFANDLNPESYKWLQHNAKLNRVDLKMKMYNLDAGCFIRDVIREHLVGLIGKKRVHVVMNLPTLATEFLKNFHGLCTPELPEITKPVTLYVYCFSKGEDCEGIAKKLVNAGFGFDVTDKIIEVFRVRTVSSMKEMMRVTLNLDREILVGNKRKADVDGDVDSCVVMGKNKQKKSKNVFKVAGAKSLKSKSKAKPVTGHLKNIKVQTKAKIQEIDKQLVNLQDKVMLQSKKKAGKKGKKGNKQKQQMQKEFEQVQEKTTTVINTMDTMQL